MLTAKRLYIAVAIAAIVPIWCVRYLPTVDGPSHLYNSWLLHQLIRGADGPIAEWFRVDWRPHPNWIGHALMAALMTVVPPVVAEKLVVTGIVLLFLAGTWMYAGAADARNRLFAFLAVPFAYNLLLQNGFYNFSAGVGMYFLTIAVWWRRRHRPTAGTIALTAALLLLCYFSHMLPAALAVGSIGLLWLTALPGQRLAVHARHLLAFVPVVPLLLWFGPVGGAYLRGATRRGELLRWLAEMKMLHTFDHRQVVYGLAIAVLLAALIVVTLVRRPWRQWRESDAFLLLTVAVAAIYAASQFVTPDVQERVSLFVVLMPLAWLDARLPRWTPPVFAALALAVCGYIIRCYSVAGAAMERFVRGGDSIAPRTTLLPLLYQLGPPGIYTPIYSHAVDYIALEKECVDIANYEPVLGWFPIALRPGVVPADIYDLAPPHDVPDFAAYAARAQHIFIWSMTGDPKLAKRLARYYARVGGRGMATVFGTIAGGFDRVLLPLVGTTYDRGAPAGMLWRVEQRVRNDGSAPAAVGVPCEEPPCSIDLAPGASAAIKANLPYGFALVPRKATVRFTTALRRADPAGGGASVDIPAVRERDFRDGRLVIDGLPFADPHRVTLRVWTTGHEATVTLRDAAGNALASRPLALDGGGAAMLPDLVHDFAGAAQRREPVSVEVDAAGAKVWAFVSAADPSAATPSLFFPR